MKKKVIIGISIFILFGISLALIKFPEQPLKELELVDGIVMTIKDGTLTKTSATIIITSNVDTEYKTGSDYSINKYIDGNWYNLKVKTQCVVTLMTQLITKERPLELFPKWEKCYESLDKGKYRIVKKISPSYDSYEKKDIAVEFTID